MLLTQWESMKMRVRPDGSKETEPALAEWLKADRGDIRRHLNALAFDVHRSQRDLTGTADIPQEKLVAALLRASRDQASLNLAQLEHYLRDRAGLLNAHGVDVYQFPHRSFQEYLAACHLTDDDFPDQLASLVREEPDRWREVALLASAKAARGSSLNVWALAETLCPADPSKPTASDSEESDQWGALLAGQVLAESADLDAVAARDKPKRDRIRDWQFSILRDDTLPATERALAGRTLDALGDPRREVMRLDNMEFCRVPAGPFVMGGDLFDDEMPQHEVSLDYDYWIGRYPVTVGQWRSYLSTSACEVDDEGSLAGRDNEPVTHVTWFDVVRFCAFLNNAWRTLLPEGLVVAPPSEAEWEKASRGGLQRPETPIIAPIERISQVQLTAAEAGLVENAAPDREYPWGNEFYSGRANVEQSIGETTAVGCYADGASVYGVEDLSGNALEWTRSHWGSDVLKPDFAYPYDPEDPRRETLGAGDDILRVVRGGSWFNHRDNARCAYRNGNQPVNRSNNLGFRLVLRSVPVS